MDGDFSEAHLAKLFSARARSKIGMISDAIRGAVELGKFIAQAIRDRKKPKTAREIFAEHPSELEAIQREAGRSMVGTPEGE